MQSSDKEFGGFFFLESCENGSKKMLMGGTCIFVHLSVHCIWETAASLNQNNPELQFLKDYGFYMEKE